MKFSIEITLGNDAMLTGDDVADALITVAGKVRDIAPFMMAGRIFDANGNPVGEWSFCE